MDEPIPTNPIMYSKIKNHPTITAIYSKKLICENTLIAEEVKTIETATLNA